MNSSNKKLNIPDEATRIQSFLKKTLEKSGMKKYVVATSGGIDSSVVAMLCIKAVGRGNVIFVNLPYSGLNEKGLNNSSLLMDFLGVPSDQVYTIDIRTAVDAICQSLGISEKDNLRRGNIMARVRMIMLFDISKMQDALVCGTENKSEHLLGYFTRFGDEASDVEPIRHLYKTQIYEMGDFLTIPKEIISTPPTAGLWDGQTDEGQFGFSYEEADRILSLHFDSGITFDEISLKDHPKRDEVKKIVLQNEFKHSVPYKPE